MPLHSLKIGDLKLGETTAVFGAGPIGLLTIAALKMAGARRIWAIEPLAARRDLALLMGADATIDPGVVDGAGQILAETGNRGVDIVFDCATKGESSRQAVVCGAARGAGGVHRHSFGATGKLIIRLEE